MTPAERVRLEYVKCRRALKIVDTLAAGIAIVNGAFAYIEVTKVNIYNCFRMSTSERRRSWTKWSLRINIKAALGTPT